MINRDRDDGFEATFVVSTPRRDAWERLTRAAPAFDGIGTARDGQWWLPGWETPADELEVVPEELLRARKAIEPCKGTEIVIRLEDEESGTRITIVQTGFGEHFSSRRAWLASGWWPILADVVVFFERGISLGRHASFWWYIGAEVVETDEGVVVDVVRPEGFAADAGLQKGDLVLQLAGAPITSIRDLAVLVRGPLRTGVETKVRYLRGTSIDSGRGTIRS